jgi:hypothetical protein
MAALELSELVNMKRVPMLSKMEYDPVICGGLQPSLGEVKISFDRFA